MNEYTNLKDRFSILKQNIILIESILFDKIQGTKLNLFLFAKK